MAAAIVLLSEVMLSSHPQLPPRDTSTSKQSSTAVIRGRVVAADSHEPLRNVRITLGGIGSIPPVFTGDDGRFVFAGLPSGQYTVSARKAGYAPTVFGHRRPDLPPMPIDLEAGGVFQDAELRMPRSAAISGRIVDEFGDPLELANVTASRIVAREGLVVGMPGGTAVTDDLGEYRVGGLAEGTYIVVASMPKRGEPPARTYYPGVAVRMQAQPIVLRAGEERSATDLTVSPRRLPKLTIAFTDVKGEPVSAAAVMANVSQLADVGVPVIPMNGSVVTPTLEPGEWSIFARSPEGVGFARVSVGSDDAAITMRLAKGGRVTGRVVGERGSPPSDAAFLVEAVQAAPSTGVTLPPAGWSARVSGSSAFELTELLGSRVLRVRPVEMERAASAPEALRRATPELARETGERRREASAERRPRWFVTAIVHGDRNLLDETIDFNGGETLADVQIVVSDRGGTLNGSAVDAQGARRTDYFVLVFADEARPLARLRRLSRASRSNHKGDFTIDALPPGAYLAVALDDIGDVPLLTLTPDYVDGLRARTTPFTVDAGRTTTVTVNLAP